MENEYGTIYKISSIEEYGKLLAYLINNDFNVFRLFWDERDKHQRCYSINYATKRVGYSNVNYYKRCGYTVYNAYFTLDQFGNYEIRKGYEL